MHKLMGGGGGAKGQQEAPPSGAGQDETEDLSPDEGNLLLSLISQLRPGADLSRLTFPTFVLEPRSMLERITDFLAHPDLVFGAGKIEDANERFITVLTYYLAGWHIKPKGVKKPYNPVLGEIFRCRYKYKDGSQGFYVAEQVSHHPPISAFYYCSPENNLEIFGELRPKSKFLGNSAANEMGGCNHVVLLDRPEDGEYDVAMPNMYARGILFGKMVLELGDIAKVSNNNTGIHCDVDFKTKGFFSGSYNHIHGKIKSSKGEVGEISGKWSNQMYIQRSKKEKELIFDAEKAVAVPKTCVPESEQETNESRRLWSKVTQAIKKNDQDAATDEKTAIEDHQRELAKMREDAGEKWKPKYFALGKNDEHRAMFKLPQGDKKEQIKAVETWIFGKTSADAAPAEKDASASESESVKPEAKTSQTEPSTQKSPAENSSPTVPSVAVTSADMEGGSSKGSTDSTRNSQQHPTTNNTDQQLSTTPNSASTPISRSHSPSSGKSSNTSTATSKKEHHVSKPIAAAANALGLGGHSSSATSGSSTPDSTHHGAASLFKWPSRKAHSGSVSNTAPDHEASSRRLP